MERICKFLFILLFKVLSTNGDEFLCDFESDMCEWKNENKDGLVWTRGQGSTVTPFTGPSEDHTKNMGNGWYVYVDVSKKSGKARLLGPNITGTYCLQFWYHMFGADVNILRTQMKLNDKTELVFYRKGTQGNRWKEARMTIGDKDLQYQVIFEVEHTYKKYIKGDIALDDIHLKSEPCSLTKVQEDELCTFDNGNCGYSTVNDTNFQWSFVKAKTARVLWPKSDHSFGTNNGWYWILFTKNKPKNMNSKAVLLSPKFTKSDSGTRCIQFYHYVYSELNTVLNVSFINELTEEKLIFSKEAFKKKIWTYTEAQFNPNMRYQMKFQGTFVDSTNSIAIDDVKVKIGTCPESGSCTFEENLCTWSHGEGDLRWLRNNGQATSTEKGPNMDHSKGKKGHYVFLNIENKTPNMTARLESDTFPSLKNKKRCIGFWYSMNGTNVGSLKVHIKIAGETDDLLWELDGDQGLNWQRGIIPLYSAVKEYQVIFEGIVGNGNKGFIALDDITFADGDCKVLPLKANLYNLELAKANCSFDDLTFCEWNTVKSGSENEDVMEWKFGNKSSIPQNTGPLEPLNGKGHYIFISTPKMPIKANTKAVLQFYSVKGRNEEICLSFYYYMFGAHIGGLKVYLNQLNGKRKNVWQKFGTQSDKWHNYQVTLNLDENTYTLEFEATPGDGFAGDIALDEIGLTLGLCTKYGL